MQVEVEVNPTEDSSKVRLAVENVFGNMRFDETPQRKGSLLLGQNQGVDSLSHFGSLLRRERIRAAARAVLSKGRRGKTISFCLNRQVAFVGHVSFCEPVAESPLGPIRVEITCDRPFEVIDFLAPRT